MRVKPSTSIALLFMLLLVGQAMTSHLNQIPGESEETTLEPTALIMSSNNTTDTDGDGVYDVNDDCANGATNWTSSSSTDYDSDGCRDSTEDSDDDNDGVSDSYDSCSIGSLGWISSSSTDYDSDGCKDTTEDMDDDNDGVLDGYDSCPKGDLGWTSSSSTDADSDGCRDSTEDSDGGNNSGNNTGGNNTGGNNTGGNNTGGGNNSTSDAHCLILNNATMNQTNYVTVDLINTCSAAIMYPGINASSDNSGVEGLYDIWWYGIGGNNTTNNMGWQLFINQSVQNGTAVTLYFEATVLNCGPNNSWAHDCPTSTLSYQFTVLNNNNGGNNTGGNNSGGNNTGGNNSGGNNTGGNNSGGNNTGGNNSGGNNTGGNNTGGNNTGGNNSQLSYTGGLDKYCYDSNATSIQFDLQVTIPGESQFDLEWEVIDDNQNIVASDAVTFFLDSLGGFNSVLSITPTSGSSFFPDGEYTFMANPAYSNNLSNIFNSSPYFYNFEVGCNNGGNNSGGNNTGGNNTGGNNTGGNNTGGNNTGGNNTGGNNTGNNTGCGYNSTYLTHTQSVTGQPFIQAGIYTTNSVIFLNDYVACTVIGESYQLDVTLIRNGATLVDDWLHNWTESNTYEMFKPWGSHPIGSYCVNSTLYITDGSAIPQPLTQLSNLESCFVVIATGNGGGNNTGGNNTGGNNTGGNNTGNSSGGNTPGMNVSNPVMPTNCSELNAMLANLTNLNNQWNLSDCENGTGFWFDVVVNGTGVTWFDPIYAVGYEFEVLSGPNFASVNVPVGTGDDFYEVYLWNGTDYQLVATNLQAGQEYWFTGSLSGNALTYSPSSSYTGVERFAIGGLEISAQLDPTDPNGFVTGLSFIIPNGNSAQVVMSMTPVTASDMDDDGFEDSEDNCWNISNTDQLDTDGDNLGDLCDLDDDNDGLDDSNDVFPLDPSEQMDSDNDGIGNNLDSDDDGDGVTDSIDNCPLTPNSDQADLDGDGIGSECDDMELTTGGNGTIDSDGDSIPSIGMVGTVVAISAGFFLAIRREDEE